MATCMVAARVSGKGAPVRGEVTKRERGETGGERRGQPDRPGRHDALAEGRSRGAGACIGVRLELGSSHVA